MRSTDGLAERPVKRARLLDDEVESDNETKDVLRVNDEYAKRFEHNKKRAELQRRKQQHYLRAVLV